MAVHFSSDVFPSDASVRQKSGLPWGCVITPFADVDAKSVTDVPAAQIARCSECFGYISAFCKFQKKSWTCTLCQTSNSLTERYSSVDRRARLPELSNFVVEVLMDDESSAHVPLHERDNDYPTYVFLVDCTGDAEYMELIKASLLAALEAISPRCWFGMIVFSHKLGVFDMRGSVPHVKFTRIPTDEGPLPIALEDILHLDDFLVRLSEKKDNVAAAIESLSNLVSVPAYAVPPLGTMSSGSVESKDAAGYAKGTVEDTPRGFGAAIEGVVAYLTSEEYKLNARVLTFLAGRPNLGVGALKNRYAVAANHKDDREKEEHVKDSLNPQTEFYKHHAAVAAKGGVCFDLFILSQLAYTDVSSLKFLPLVTGGNLLLYDNVADALLPQDIFRQLSRPQAFRGLLRIRTSKEFEPLSVYGHLIRDEDYEQLYHIAGCDAHQTIAVDFEFVDSGSFSLQADAPPVIQVAFSYTSLERTQLQAADQSLVELDVPVRRLRIITFRLDASIDPVKIYAAAHPEVIVTLLTQQVIQAMLENGVKEARFLLTDWLINLIVSYNRALVGDTKKQPDWQQLFDSVFVRASHLMLLPRFVFAMLKHDLLSLQAVHPDLRAYYQCIFSALDPGFLCKAFYATLTPFSDLNTLAGQSMLVQRATIESSNMPVLLLDQFTHIVVYFTQHSAQLPFPPPHDTEIRKAIKKLKQVTPLISPKVDFVQAGTPEAQLFERRIIEEADAEGFSYPSFFNTISADARKALK